MPYVPPQWCTVRCRQVRFYQLHPSRLRKRICAIGAFEMAVPYRRKSRSRSRMHRAATMKYSAVNHTACSTCGEPKLPHRVCSACGQYKGQQVLESVEQE